MATQLYVSNDLHSLSLQLAQDLRVRQVGVFASQHIVTQTEGIDNWLKNQLAQQLGITANCSFLTPNDIVSQLYFWLLGPQKPPISLDFVKWAIFQELEKSDFKLAFPSIATYYKNNDVKRVALADKLSDLFDQYQVYRPEIILEWNTRNNVENVQDDWQQWLWIRIRQLIADRQQDKTALVNDILEAIKNSEKQETLKRKLPLLSFFGIAVITPFYLKLFHELARFIDIHFYLINPAPEYYWLEDKSEQQIARLTNRNPNRPDPNKIVLEGNSLLLNWGKIIKDSFYLLFQDEEMVNAYTVLPGRSDLEQNRLLNKIQFDIFTNAPASSRSPIDQESLRDGSIIVNSCFTPVREVEVLYNYLVELIDKKGEQLSPRDIVVMVTDIDSYAPYIRAVFNNAPYSFPYTIADETIGAGNNLFSALKQVLTLDPRSFKVEEVMELLESSYIKNRFSLNDIDLIRETVGQAGIRFGLDGNIADDTRLFSWNYGVKKIFYGLCISGEPSIDTGTDILEPLDSVEGGDSNSIIPFLHFIEVLQYYVKRRAEPKTLSEWARYIQELVEDLIFQAGEKDDEDYHRLVGYLEKMVLLDNESDALFSFEVFQHSFLQVLSAEKRSHAFSSGGITFCSLIPMRSIPFKVVALLGMNFDQFPRKEQRLSFSLLEQQSRRGDRNVKDNDKHLFLETIVSAQRYLYISYIGRNPKDGSIRPPASLLDELLEYILQGLPAGSVPDRNQLIQQHPLQSFSQKYFDGSGLINYLSDEKFLKNEPIKLSARTLQELDQKSVTVAEVTSFFKDPFKWYINRYLNVFYRETDVLLPDTEPFELDGLEQWTLREELIYLPESDYESFRKEKIRKGQLPLVNMSRWVMEEQSARIAALKKRTKIVIDGIDESKLDIRLSFADLEITGSINGVFGDRMLFVNTSSRILKNFTAAYTQYLLLLAQGYELDLYFISAHSEIDFRIEKGMISKSIAEERLAKLISDMRSGYQNCYAFYPNIFKEIFGELNFTFENFVNWINDRMSKTGKEIDHSVQDPYFQLIWQSGYFTESIYEQLKKNSLYFFEPIKALLPDLIK